MADTIFFLLLKAFPKPAKHSGLLLVRMDSIGDYILFRNYLHAIAISPRFNAMPITLAGNELWKDVTEQFDVHIVPQCIWINRKQFRGNLLYRYKTLLSINRKNFLVAVETTYSREVLFGDTIVRASAAPLRIGAETAKEKPSGWKSRLLSTKIYTQLFPMQAGVMFEFNRNCEFIGQLLNTNLRHIKLELLADGIEQPITLPEVFIAVVPGAQYAFRQWSADNFAALIARLDSMYRASIVLFGSVHERELCEEIIKKSGVQNCINTAALLTLPEYAGALKKAGLLITNETGAVHIAAAVKTSFICISNGHDIGRFHPYPREVFPGGVFLYPVDEDVKLHAMIQDSEKIQGRAHHDINMITVERVITVIEQVMRDAV